MLYDEGERSRLSNLVNWFFLLKSYLCKKHL